MQKIYSYQVNFEADKEGYTVTVPALPGCVSFGKNIEEATKNIKQAIKLHLECLKEHKKKVPADNKSFYSALIQVNLSHAR